MKLFLIGAWLLAAFTCPAAPAATLLPDAVTRNLVAISPQASGLGANNLTVLLKNNNPHEVTVQVPPGLHFKASDAGAQDLFTIQPQLIVLKPNSENTVQLTGYCMNASNFSPKPNTTYIFKGYAASPLRTLGDSLAKYPPLTEAYAQMFVWALTNNRLMYDFEVDKAYLRPARNIMNYVARVGRVPAVNVTAYSPNTLKTAKLIGNSVPRASVNVFSKRAVLAFHNPTNAVASFKVFDDKGKVKHVLFENKQVRHGLTEYTFGINDIVPPGTSPVYKAKVISSTGAVLAEMKVDKHTEEVKINPLTKEILLSFALEKGVKNADLNIYLEDGTLVENFKRYAYLPVGHYNLSVTLKHLHPANTRFVTKLVGPTGEVYAQHREE